MIITITSDETLTITGITPDQMEGLNAGICESLACFTQNPAARYARDQQKYLSITAWLDAYNAYQAQIDN